MKFFNGRATGLGFASRDDSAASSNVCKMQESMMIATRETSRNYRDVRRTPSQLPPKRAVDSSAAARDSGNRDVGPLEFVEHVETTVLRHQSWWRFLGLYAVIAGVSTFDACLALRYRAELIYTELNFVGKYLLRLVDGDPTLFLSLKFLGTMVTLGVLMHLYLFRPKWGLTVGTALATFQLGLLAFLMLA
jgi:hypothetical protein